MRGAPRRKSPTPRFGTPPRALGAAVGRAAGRRRHLARRRTPLSPPSPTTRHRSVGRVGRLVRSRCLRLTTWRPSAGRQARNPNQTTARSCRGRGGGAAAAAAAPRRWRAPPRGRRRCSTLRLSRAPRRRSPGRRSRTARWSCGRRRSDGGRWAWCDVPLSHRSRCVVGQRGNTHRLRPRSWRQRKHRQGPCAAARGGNSR
mmetsp:Transcript_38124/g.117801  ORF Transcript_38124/g.117801 Transcript_38124/m.117801 type:complete len:201 (-) Transcript_38124:131-733(-)